MKQLKFWMVALTLLMGVSFTSCLNSDDAETYDIPGLAVFVKDYMGMVIFEDMQGNRLIPTTASVTQLETNNQIKLSNYGWAIIYGDYVEKNTNVKATEVDIVLKSFLGYPLEDVFVVGSTGSMEEQMPENAPIISVDNSGFGLFNAKTLMIPMQWHLGEYKLETFKLHKLKLICVEEEIEVDDTELVLYVRHDRGTDEGKGYKGGDWYGYNIANALDIFRSKTGKQPIKLVIKTHENAADTNIPEIYTEHVVEYKDNTTN